MAVEATTLDPDFDRRTIADLRTDHAGETGAVAIYAGVLAVSRDAAVRRFARDHLATERRHLALIGKLLPASKRSRLTPLWSVAGWITGAAPALFGARAVYATVAAVETFVDAHYEAQVRRLSTEKYAALSETLVACQADEVAHRDEAAELLGAPAGPLLRLWTRIVAAGSAAAVAASRRI